jgi:thiamine-phosphate pyrophosphorylase
LTAMYLGGLCFITDRRISQLSYEEMTLRALRAGVRCVQYRNKEQTRREIFRASERLRGITRDFDALLIINDHPDIALAADADGVHLGQDDLPLKEARQIMGKDRIIGISTHDPDQAAEAETSGADYIGFGPIFYTATKDAGSPKGILTLREIKSKVRIPVVAIGGITLNNVGAVLESGADAVAVATAILEGDIEENARSFLDVIRAADRISRSGRG